MTLGQRLRQLREQKGWSRVTLAYKSRVHWSTIIFYENGHRYPGIDNLRSLCNALGVTLGAFHKCTPNTKDKRPHRMPLHPNSLKAMMLDEFMKEDLKD